MSRLNIPGKWISGIDAGMPATDAARRVLKLRMKALELLLPLAEVRADEDVEFIHQLRVASRRADAAVRLFGRCMRKKDLRSTRSRLRRIRRAAGLARECDVHAAMLDDAHRSAQGGRAVVLRELIAWTHQQRQAAQLQVLDVATRYPVKKLKRRRAQLLTKLRDPRLTSSKGDSTFSQLAHATLGTVVDAVDRAADADLNVLDHLHELRIVGKRLRYALEIFAPCFRPDFKTLYARVEAMQDVLGAINDDHELLTRVHAFAAQHPSHSPAATELAIELAGRLHNDHMEFVVAWDRGDWRDVLHIGSAAELNGVAVSAVAESPEDARVD